MSNAYVKEILLNEVRVGNTIFRILMMNVLSTYPVCRVLSPKNEDLHETEYTCFTLYNDKQTVP